MSDVKQQSPEKINKMALGFSEDKETSLAKLKLREKEDERAYEFSKKEQDKDHQ